MPFNEATGLRVMQAWNGMFEPYLSVKVWHFLGVKRWSVVHEDFQGYSFNGKQLNQVADDSIHSGAGYVK